MVLNKKFTFKLLFFIPVIAAALGTFLIILLSLSMLKADYGRQQAQVREQLRARGEISRPALVSHEAGEKSFNRLYWQVLLSSMAGLATMLLVSFLVMLRFIGPMNKIVAALKTLAYTTGKPPDLVGVSEIQEDRVRELAEMANSVLSFHEALNDRQRVESELRKLSLVVDQSPGGIVITDLAGNIEYVNQAFLTESGYDKMELLGQNPRILQSGNTPRSTYEEMWRSIEAGKPWRGEFINRRKDGREYIETNMIAPIKRADGTVTNYLAIKEDVSERIKLEVEVLRHRDHLAELVEEQTASIKAIVDTAADGIFTVDQRGEIISFNTAAEQIFGYSADEMVGRNISCLMPRAHGAKHDQYMRQYLAGEKTMIVGGRAEVEGRRRDGSVFPLYLAISEMVIGGEKRFTVIGRDISAQKEAEAALIASREAAEAASRAKGDFLANMSHEIRTPMNAIIGLSHLCLQTELNDKQRDYLVKVHRSARSLLGILNDILDFSKIEAGKLEIERRPFALAEVMEQLAAIVDARMEAKELEFKQTVAPEVPPRLLGDPLRLGQVLTNLVGNAVKFTERGGIEVRVEVADESAHEVVLRCTIRDSGIGMSPEQCRRIFSSFSQADTSISRKYGGTGLGLAISKQLVELMDGSIEVTSEPGVGSTFTFTGRFGKTEAASEDEASTPLAPPAGPAVKLSGARLLLAEDDAINRQVAQELLAPHGIELIVVEDGAQALARLEQEEFDGVLLDLQMPVMDGITAAGKIRAQERFKGLPIIAMTANAMPSDLEKCRAAGMNDHIGKPVEPDSMMATLSKWITPVRPAPRPEPESAAAPGQAAPALTLRDLAVLPGVRVQDGVRRLNGRVDLYVKVLADFRRKQGGAVLAMRQALAAGEYQPAVRLAHTLKGLAGTIGAPAIRSLAEQLEQQLAQNPGAADQRESLLQPLEQELANLTRAIERLLARPAAAAGPPTASTPAATPAELQALVVTARAQLEEFDSGVEETVARLQALVGQDLQAGEPLERLAACLGDYDYEQGLAELLTLEKVIQKKEQAAGDHEQGR